VLLFSSNKVDENKRRRKYIQFKVLDDNQ